MAMKGKSKGVILWLLPAFGFFLFMGVYPLAYSLWLAFHNLSLADPTRPFKFLGFGNFGDLIFQEGILRQTFLTSLKLTGIYASSSLVLELSIGMGLALLFAERRKLTTLARVLVMIPMLLAPVVVGNIMKLMLVFPFGLLNYPFLAAGATPPMWLVDWALFSVIITNAWMWTPFSFLVILAAMYSVPQQYYEAARVAGASAWQELRFVTLPLIRKGLLVICLIRGIDLIRTFDIILPLTEGGPAQDTALLGFNTYWLGFRYWELSAGAAYSYLVLIIVNVVVIGFVRFLAKEVKAKRY